MTTKLRLDFLKTSHFFFFSSATYFPLGRLAMDTEAHTSRRHGHRPCSVRARETPSAIRCHFPWHPPSQLGHGRGQRSNNHTSVPSREQVSVPRVAARDAPSMPSRRAQGPFVSSQGLGQRPPRGAKPFSRTPHHSSDWELSRKPSPALPYHATLPSGF